MYRTVWEFVRDTYHDRTFNGQDWRAWRSRFDGALDTAPRGLGAIALMLSSLDDRNTRIRDVERTVAMFFAPRSLEPVFSESGAAERSSATVEARRLDDNVGYIAITNLDDPRATAQIKEAVETLSSADGIILDLRGNMGGSDADVAQITGMFVKPDTRTGTIVSPDRTKVAVTEAPPGRETPIIAEDKPVVVLVDRNTASSAENLAGSLKESRRAILVGEKTFGKAGIQMPLLLPGGNIILVVSAEHADLEGNVYTGVGIEPDVHVEDPIRTSAGAASASAGGEDRAVSRAREVLKRRRK
jgi:C-terminal processing protease CtpA/Prc